MATTTLTILCPDCNQPLHAEEYTNWRGLTTITHTCKTAGCLLNSVTLTASEWQTKDLNVYRLINQKAQPARSSVS